MKKSGTITLLLVTSLLGCNKHKPRTRLYMRTDTTGKYTPGTPGFNGYYSFVPYGSYYDGGYRNGSYYGGSFVREGYSNAGIASSGEGISRGGFGNSEGFHASS